MFGMGTGVTSSPWPPRNLSTNQRALRVAHDELEVKHRIFDGALNLKPSTT